MSSALTQGLIPEEFPIDATPMEMHPCPYDAFSEEQSRDGREDLLSAIGRVMYDSAQLEVRVKLLEAGEGTDDPLEKVVRQMLPFFDNFWRVLDMGREHAASEEVANWLKNFELIYDRMARLFESYGLVFINSVGKEVNLDCQDVIEYRPTTNHPHNYVIKELERGAVFRNRLIRDAKVIVAYNP